MIERSLDDCTKRSECKRVTLSKRRRRPSIFRARPKIAFAEYDGNETDGIALDE